jgi:protease-4
MQVYMESTWDTMLDGIVASRGLKSTDLNVYANNLQIKNVNDAVENGMMDKSMYRDEVLKILMEKVKVKDEKELNFYSFSSYSEEKFLTDQILARASEPKVAVILAEGSIAKTGKGFSSDNICALFKKARANESIKSVVFRVNSPGGSALASEEIWREVSLTNKVKKVIVSMGDYAASGGYYVSTPAHKIFADQTTLTGSIGVFGVLPYTKEMLGKIGVEVDAIGTHDHSVVSTNHKLSGFEFETAQQEVNEIYQQFLLRVANGRGMSKEQVDAIARGRVWTGADAVKIGLVDTIGTLQAAISYAHSISNSINDESVVYYPEVEEKPFADLISLLEDERINIESKQNILNHPILESLYENIESAQEWKGMVMRLPFQIEIK